MKQPEIIVSFILDKSGSMSSLKGDVIGGFNEYLTTLRKKEANVKFSLTLFDTDSIEKRYVNTPLSEVRDLTNETYRPNSMTPLYDAVVETVEELFEKTKENKDASVIVVIMTDGLENASSKHDEKCMRELIEKLQKEYKWTFVYMGANQDSYKTAANYGILRGNTVNWGFSEQGTKSAFIGMAMASVNYVSEAKQFKASGGIGGHSTQDFFSSELKADIEKEVK